MIFAHLKSPVGTICLWLKEILYHQNSKYQEIIIANTPMGLSLILDSELQSCSETYEAYHKALICPFKPSNEDRALVIGSGEGVIVNELLKRNWKVTALELDSDVIEACKLLKEWNDNIYERTDEYELIIMDGLKYLEKCPDNTFKNIVFDLNSEAMCAKQSEWIHHLRRVLAPSGALTWQDGPMESETFLGREIFKSFGEVPDYIVDVGWRFGAISKKENKDDSFLF